jgi:uncharacterized protein YkwD
MGRRNGLATVVMSVVLGVLGCAEDPDDAGTGAASCIPNTAYSCACLDSSVGQQVCALDGLSLGPCSCGPVAGSGGAGTGMAGTGVAGSGSAGAGMAGSSSVDLDAGPDGSSEPDAMTFPPGEEVPDSAHCAAVAGWDPEWTAFENEVLRLVNINRAKGWNCDSEGSFGATTALTSNRELRCAARLHSLDMNERQFFAHNAPGGSTPKTRMDATGYAGTTWGENIAKGQSTPAEVVQGWMDSDGHCANIMSPMFKEIGVGFYEGEPNNPYYNENLYWTQNFGAPCTQSWCM